MDYTSLIGQLNKLSAQEREEIFSLLDEFEQSKKKEDARSSYLKFVKYLWPDFVEGHHHRIIAEIFDDIVSGKEKRVIINMAPRHSKSEFASVFLPAYFLGRFPNKKIIQTSHTAELAVGFGRRVRGIINGGKFNSLFRDVTLSADSKAAGRWATNRGGEYHAIGVGGKIAGKGADLFIIDDPHSEQEAIMAVTNPEVYDKVMEWYEGGPRQRLQPGAAIVLVQTRWSMRDLTAQLIKKQQKEPGADRWKIVELPAILPNGKPIWPEFWPIEELLQTKASIPPSKWNAQYQQKPTSDSSALIKREYWSDWSEPDPPDCDVVLQSWDTAFMSKTRADYSAVTTWGVFFDREDEKNKIILLDAVRGKWEFPELKERALRFHKQWKPEITLIEARAAGHPLIFELRKMGIPVQEHVVGRGSRANPNDKISRVNGITDIFASGFVYAPKDRQFAQEVIEECASFPAGENDDYVDTVTMALTRFRYGGWIGTRLDEEDDMEPRAVSHEYY